MSWKTTVIIPTGPAPLQCLVWSIVSLLIRSDISKIDQIIVSINGPDSRTGETLLQDQKQTFCESLRQSGYPITVIRSWSRVGFSAPIQMSLPLVKTDNYLLMHDDVIVLNNDWQSEAEIWLKSDVLGVVQPPVLSNKLVTSILSNDLNRGLATTFTYLPSLNTTFSIFKISANFQWSDYNCWIKEDEALDIVEINKFYEKKPKTYTLLAGDGFKERIKKFIRLELRNPYKPELIQYNCGAWAAYKIICENKIATLSRVAHHLDRMSSKTSVEWEVNNPDSVVRELIEDIQLQPQFLKHYNFPIPKAFDFSELKPLVCVLVYDRIDNIAHWIKSWKKSNHYNGKLLIVQNIDDTEKCRKNAQIISDLEPDYHWLRKNDNESIKHWFELLHIDDIDFDWNVLFSFTDDCIPLRKDFLMPLLSAFSTRDNLGVTGGILANYEKHQTNDEKYFQRSVCIGIKKEVLEKIENIAYQEAVEHIAYQEADGNIYPSFFSINCEQRLWKWTKEIGYEIACTDYDWSLIFGWDCDNQGVDDLWDKSNFNIFDSTSDLYSFS